MSERCCSARLETERTQGNGCVPNYPDETGTRTMDILNEMKQLHEERLRRIEQEAGRDSAELKVKVMESWIADLEEQNTMLVQILGKLEQEAGDRVTLLKEKLHTSAQATSRFMESEQDRDKLVNQLREENEHFQKTIVQFFNKHQELQSHIASQYKQHLGRTNERSQKLQRSPCENDLDESIDCVISCFDDVLQERQQLLQEVETLQSELAAKTAEIDQLNNKVLEMDKSARDMREALAVEVADKHDQIISLRREIHHLEDRCRQADMQTHFKDDIIKEMRKDLKTAKSRLEEKQMPEVSSCKEVCVGTDHTTDTSSENYVTSNLSVKEIFNYRYTIKSPEVTERKLDIDVKETKSNFGNQKLSTEDAQVDLVELRRNFENSSASEEDGSVTTVHLKLKSVQNVAKAFKDKAQAYVQDLRLAEQNQADSERRIRELKSILEMSQHQIGRVLERASEVDMAIPYVQEVQKYNEGSQEAFKNMRAEIHFLLFNLRSRVQKCSDFEESISSLELSLEELQDSLSDVQNRMNTNAMHAQSAPNQGAFDKQADELHKELSRSKEDQMRYRDQIQELEVDISTLRQKASEVDILEETLFRMKSELETVTCSLDAKEQIVKDQEEMIIILQDSVNTAEKEQSEVLSRLATLENEKEKALSELEEVEKRAENLQEALLATKKQLEELQGSKFEVSVSSWGWPHSNRNVARRTVHDV